jgi:hypothetical protein
MASLGADLLKGKDSVAQRSGVLAGGNWIVDRVKIVDCYPEQDGLARILGHSISNGGSPYNLLKDLARLEAPFPLRQPSAGCW